MKKLLRESILDEDKKGPSVAVIQGMGGVGKSTLAREIYNHPNVVVAGRFDCRGWVVVSSEFTPQETIKQLIFQLPRSEKAKRELSELEETTKDKAFLLQKLQEMLHKQLQGKTYFIVVDDVWEEEHWESLKSAFPNQQDKASRLLVTTRNNIMGKYCQYKHEMKGLDPEKSWELLLKKAFIGSTNSKCPKELERLGRQILEKCYGLPLAISVVGGLLAETQTQSRWEEVLNQINSYLGRADSTVSAILELSYQNLSPQLKSCFLCLAFFKEDITIPAKRLVDIWVGQGLIQQEGRGTIDEMARGYLIEQTNRSMVQIGDLTIDNQVKSCRLHDLVRDVCLRKAKEEIGLEIVKGEEGISPESSYKPRHLVVYGRNVETCSANQNKHLRSLFFLNDSSRDVYVSTPSGYWKSSQLLKILDIDCFVFQKFPHSFRFLFGLKYLRIRNQNVSDHFMVQLPSWFDHLKKLEVFDMAEEGRVVFPDVALKMERLRHFHVVSVTGKAMKIDKWKNIETLNCIRLKDWLKISSKLMASCKLRVLGIDMSGMQGDDEVSRTRASLETLTNFVELHLHFSATPVVEEIMPHLGCLTKLKLYASGSFTCPAASVFPPNLSHLTLAYLKGDPMAELGKLPNLRYLTLSHIYIPAREVWRMKVTFPCLKAISLQTILYLIGIDVEQGGMPLLKQLQIHRCPSLETRNLPKNIIILAA